MHHTNAQSFNRGNCAPAQNEFQCFGFPDQTRQTLCAASTGKNTDIRFRQSDPVVTRFRNTNVAAESELETAALHKPVDRGNGRLRHTIHLVENRRNRVAAFARRHQLLFRSVASFNEFGNGHNFCHVIVPDKDAGHAACEDHNPHGVVRRDLIDDDRKFLNLP